MAVGDFAVDHRNLVGDVLEAVHTFLQGDGLAEVVFIGLGLFGAERNGDGLGLGLHDLDFQQFGRGRARQQLGAGGDLLIQALQVGVHLGQ